VTFAHWLSAPPFGDRQEYLQEIRFLAVRGKLRNAETNDGTGENKTR